MTEKLSLRARRKSAALLGAGKLAPILANADRLVVDARTLRSARRYPSATALAILSLEESAKLALSHDELDWVSKPTAKATLRHKNKQRAAGELLLGRLTVRELEAFLSALGLNWDSVSHDGRTSREKIVNILSSIGSKKVDPLLSTKIKRVEYLTRLARLLRGEFEAIKQACFYAEDTDAPFDLPDRRTCDAIIGLASAALVDLERELSRVAIGPFKNAA